MSLPVTLIPGDGVGPEVVAAARVCIESTGVEIDWDIQEAGKAVMEDEGTPLPRRVLDSVRENKVALKGPVTTPVGYGFRSVNVAIRKSLDLYACIRPSKYYPGIVSPYKDVDIVIVRENTEDLYAGIEFESNSAGSREIIDFLKNRDLDIKEDSGISIKPISKTGSERIVEYAFEYARRNKREKVTAVHKANIMKHTDGLFLEVAREVAGKNSDIEFDNILVDNLAMQLVQNPHKFDVLVLPNLYGDIISDLCAGLTGGLGVAPGVNMGRNLAVFEPTHGSAPDIAGEDKVNPSAAILSGVMMLYHLGKEEEAKVLEKALARVIKEGRKVTFDLKSPQAKDEAVTTREMSKEICREIYRIKN
ncbi:MAG: isocitrate/isopropylmalate dehydrogenase family protein [Elusimicrobiota bacterium]